MEKKYNVYGIGNALVDIAFEVSDDFLQKHNVQKGVMTLVDEETQHELIEDINKRETVKNPGGSAANTVYAVSQFGGHSFYSCKVAEDDMGDIYLRDMEEAGITTNFVSQDREKGITGRCLVMITDDAERTMNSFLGITAELSTREIDEDALKESEYVYIEGYPISADKGLEAMKKTIALARKHEVKTALTLSDPSVAEAFRARFEQVIGGGIDLLFCNEEEAKVYTGTDSVEKAREVLKEGASQFVITRGKEGALIYDGDTFIDIEPYPVKAIDTNGAGDMFAGAFLYGITNGFGYAGAGKLASLAGSKIVSQFGPRLKWGEAKELVKEATS